MGMVFQHFNLFNNMTVIENIMMAPVYVRCKELKKAKRKGTLAPDAPKTKAEIKAQAREEALGLLRRIGLEDKADVYPSTLFRRTEAACGHRPRSGDEAGCDPLR